ncbi:hypothetical protein Tco_1244687 [Tanacetum coccineum]
MSEEDRNVEVVLPVKSDMHSYSSTMTAKDVKALAFKHNIPLDLHPGCLFPPFFFAVLDLFRRANLLRKERLCGAKKRLAGEKKSAGGGGGSIRAKLERRKDVRMRNCESREGEHVSVPHNDSANTNPDHTVDHDESFGESRGRTREEMNAYDNSTAMERAWFSIARGGMAQTDALLGFEALYDAHLALKERCEDVEESMPVALSELSNAEGLRERVEGSIQAGWAKGLAVKRSEEDLMDVLRGSRSDEVPASLDLHSTCLIHSIHKSLWTNPAGAYFLVVVLFPFFELYLASVFRYGWHASLRSCSNSSSNVVLHVELLPDHQRSVGRHAYFCRNDRFTPIGQTEGSLAIALLD